MTFVLFKGCLQTVWYDQVHFCNARRNETNFEVVWVTSRSLTGTDHIFSTAAPSSCQTMGCKQGDIILWIVSVFTEVHRLPTQWKFCEHEQPQKTCHSHLKSALTYVLYRNMSGVAEKNNRRNSELPIAYKAGLHKLESGEGCIAP